MSDAINSSFGVSIIVNDVAYVPSWGTATISNTPTAGAVDNREFKYWQDWYGGDNADTANVASATWGFELPASTRDPGEDVEVGGVAVGAQQRRLLRGSSGTGNSTTWTVPDGVEKVRITCIGGGGGGSSYSSTYYGGPGGGGGSFASGEFTVTANQQLTVTCGHGGYGNWQPVDALVLAVLLLLLVLVFQCLPMVVKRWSLHSLWSRWYISKCDRL